MQLKLSDFDIFDIILAIFITTVTIGIIWVINDAVGSFIPTSVWLLIIGLVGIFAVFVFLKARE